MHRSPSLSDFIPSRVLRMLSSTSPVYLPIGDPAAYAAIVVSARFVVGVCPLSLLSLPSLVSVRQNYLSRHPLRPVCFAFYIFACSFQFLYPFSLVTFVSTDAAFKLYG